VLAEIDTAIRGQTRRVSPTAPPLPKR
jgi:hypothetical protein